MSTESNSAPQRALRKPVMKKWTMPEWMERFRSCFVNTCGNSIEELMNGKADPVVNLPLSTIQFGAKSQVGMLEQMRKAGMI